MWNYYNIVAEQHRAELIAAVGYRVCAAARREVSEDAVAGHFRQQQEAEQEEKTTARRTAIARGANAIRTIFRSRAALVR